MFEFEAIHGQDSGHGQNSVGLILQSKDCEGETTVASLLIPDSLNTGSWSKRRYPNQSDDLKLRRKTLVPTVISNLKVFYQCYKVTFS